MKIKNNYLDLEMVSRTEELIFLLMRYPATPEFILGASKMWANPFPIASGLRLVQRLLRKLYQQGFIERTELLHRHAGQARYLYFLTPKAGQVRSEVNDEYRQRGRKSPIFQPIGRDYDHDMANALYCSLLERSIGEVQGRAHHFATLRDHQFVDRLRQWTGKEEANHIEPDRSHVLIIDGKPQLHFTEIKHFSGRHEVTTSRYLGKSEPERMKLWKAFYESGRFQKHPQVQKWQTLLQSHLPAFQRFETFQVNFVSYRRDPHYLKNLMKTAQRVRAPKALFHFARLEDLCTSHLLATINPHRRGRQVGEQDPKQSQPKNLLAHRVWRLADGKKKAWLPCLSNHANL